MSWAGRRQGVYLGTFAIIVFAIVGSIAFAFFSRPPSCTNNIKDGKETGVDCGGTCARICEGIAQEPVVLWTRYFELAPTIYTVAAMVENKNPESYVKAARYVFKLYDATNVLIAQRQGVASIAPTRFVPIVETGISTGNRVPVKAFFEFIDQPLWDNAENTPTLTILKKDADFAQRKITVTVRNDSIGEVRSVPVAVVVYDENGTAIAASRSVIARLPKGSGETVVFTWPLPFKNTPVNFEVIALPIPQE